MPSGPQEPGYLWAYRGYRDGTSLTALPRPGVKIPDLREALDIDSMDFLRFVTAIHHRLGVEIPELDYPKLVTLDGAIAYIEANLGSNKK